MADVRAGRGFVEIFTDLSPMEKGLKQIEAKMKSLGRGLSTVGGGIAGIGLAATAIGTTALGGITALATRFAGLGDVLSKAHDRTGIAASSLSELGYAAEQSGTDLGTVEKSVSKMQKSISGAVGGSKSMAAAFASIGINAKALSTLSPEQQFLAVSKAIARIKDPTMRAAKAMEVFGKSGTQLLPMITSDIAALRKEARDLGVVISDEDATNATDLGDSFDRVKKSLGGIATQIGASMAKPLTTIANTVASIIGKISAWVAINRSIVQTIAAVAAGFVVVGSIAAGIGIAIVGVGATISAIGAVIGGVIATATAVFGALASAIAAVLSPVGLVVAAVVGLGAYITYVALQSTGGLTKLSEMFGTLGTTASTAWGGIVAAISSGDLETAGQIAFTALEIAWLTVTSKMSEVWAGVSDFFRNAWLNVVEGVVQAGATIYFGIAKYADQIGAAFVDAFEIAKVTILNAISSIVAKLQDAMTFLKQATGLITEETANQQYAATEAGRSKAVKDRQDALNQKLVRSGAGLDQRDKQRRASADQFGSIVGEDFNRRRSASSIDKSGIAEAQRRMAELTGKLNSVVESAKVQEPATQPQQQQRLTPLQKRMQERQERFDKKAEETRARWQKNHPEQFARFEAASKAQEAAGQMVTSSHGGSTGSFIGGIAGNIAGGGISPMEEIGKQQLDVMSEMNQRVKEIADAGGLD